MHLGRDRVIGAWEVLPGLIVDPGRRRRLCAARRCRPGSSRAARGAADPHPPRPRGRVRRACPAFPDCAVYVHEVGAPHVIDPARLLAQRRAPLRRRAWSASGARSHLCRSERVTVLAGGEEVEGLRCIYAPGPRQPPRRLLRPRHGRRLHRRRRRRRGSRPAPSSSLRRRRRPRSTSRPGSTRSARMRALGPSGSAHPLRSDARTRGHLDRSRRGSRRRRHGVAEPDDAEELERAAAETGSSRGAEAAQRLRQAMPPEQLGSGSSATGACDRASAYGDREPSPQAGTGRPAVCPSGSRCRDLEREPAAARPRPSPVGAVACRGRARNRLGIYVYRNGFSSKAAVKELRTVAAASSATSSAARTRRDMTSRAGKGRRLCGYSPPVVGDAERPDHAV